MEKHLNDLITKAKHDEWIAGCKILVLTEDELSFVSQILGVTLSHDFVKINQKLRYDIFLWNELFGFYKDLNNWDGIIKNNLEIRKNYEKDSSGQSKERMDKILVLANDDGGSVFMITQDSPEKPAPVVWCDYGDMYHYAVTGKFRNAHDEWPSFTDFFEFLVNDLEKRAAEEE
jgi:hypothetical protein